MSHTGLSIREVRQNVSEIKRRMHMNIDSMKCYTIDSHIYVLLFFLYHSGRGIATCQGLRQQRERIGLHPCWMDHRDAVLMVLQRVFTDDW